MDVKNLNQLFKKFHFEHIKPNYTLKNFRNRTRMMDRRHLPRSTVSLISYFQSLTPLKFDNEKAQTHAQRHVSDKS